MNDNNSCRRQRGFTLTELMIVVAIAAILFMVALPAYQDQVQRTKRADGRGFLVEVAAAQERFFTQNVSYATTMAQLGYANSNSPEGYYSIAINRPTTTTFTLTVSPVAPFTDTDCGNLTLTNTNVRGNSGSATNCWD